MNKQAARLAEVERRNHELRDLLFKASDRFEMCAVNAQRTGDGERALICRKWATEAREASNVI